MHGAMCAEAFNLISFIYHYGVFSMNTKIITIKEWVVKKFTQHLEETDETYLQHLCFTTMMGCRFLFIGVIILVHGLFPFIFVRTASSQVMAVYRIMRERIPKAQKEKMAKEEHEYHGA